MEWDAIKWSSDYRKSSLEKKKELLINVWKNTVKIVQNERYFADEEILIDSSKVAENTVFFKNKQFPNRYTELENFLNDLPEDNVKISIIDADCLESARFLKNPVILNMSSYKNPGGGVVNGSAAQEENIFRRTNLLKSLYQFTHYSEVYGIKKNMSFGYPLLNLDGIYSKDITVFRGSEKNGYYLLSSPFKVSMISVSAVKRPMLKDGKMSEADLKMNREKIKMIFQISHEQGHREMVLSAFGCGAYGNPPEQIAKIFKDVIENEFAGYFDKIIFAIFDDHNSYREHNPDGNLKPFKKIFEV
jgi:uncharacterized protein (TIGR02452 family)